MNLKDKTIHAFLWLSSTRVVTEGFSWVVTILLARLLLPTDFGLIAMATLFIGFLDLINELGIGAAIIQKNDLDEDELHSTFWLSIFFGLVLYMFIFVSAPLIGSFFNSEKLPIIVRVLGLNFIISAFKIIPYNWLTKQLAFNIRAKTELTSGIMGGIVSILLAISGYGVWSLVYGSLLKNSLLAVLVLYFCPWKPRPVFLFKKVKKILNFGISVAGSRVLWYFYSNADFMIIGKLLGDRLLGYYSMAFRLSTLPGEKINGIINEISFPVFSMLQNDRKNLQLYFLKITKFTSLLILPCMAGLFLLSKSLIMVVLTEKWLPILTPFKILCGYGVLRSVGSIFPFILVAKGKQNIVLRFTAINFIVLPASFLIGVTYGISGVALAWVIAYPCLLIYIYRNGLSELDLKFSEYLKNLAPSIAASTFMALSIFLYQLGGKIIYNENMYLELIGSCIIGAVSYITYLFFLHRDILAEVIGIFNSLSKGRLKKQFALY